VSRGRAGRDRRSLRPVPGPGAPARAGPGGKGTGKLSRLRAARSSESAGLGPLRRAGVTVTYQELPQHGRGPRPGTPARAPGPRPGRRGRWGCCMEDRRGRTGRLSPGTESRTVGPPALPPAGPRGWRRPPRRRHAHAPAGPPALTPARSRSRRSWQDRFLARPEIGLGRAGPGRAWPGRLRTGSQIRAEAGGCRTARRRVRAARDAARGLWA
jgi:hypothetical protein